MSPPSRRGRKRKVVPEVGEEEANSTTKKRVKLKISRSASKSRRSDAPVQVSIEYAPAVQCGDCNFVEVRSQASTSARKHPSYHFVDLSSENVVNSNSMILPRFTNDAQHQQIISTGLNESCLDPRILENQPVDARNLTLEELESFAFTTAAKKVPPPKAFISASNRDDDRSQALVPSKTTDHTQADPAIEHYLHNRSSDFNLDLTGPVYVTFNHFNSNEMNDNQHPDTNRRTYGPTYTSSLYGSMTSGYPMNAFDMNGNHVHPHMNANYVNVADTLDTPGETSAKLNANMQTSYISINKDIDDIQHDMCSHNIQSGSFGIAHNPYAISQREDVDFANRVKQNFDAQYDGTQDRAALVWSNVVHDVKHQVNERGRRSKSREINIKTTREIGVGEKVARDTSRGPYIESSREDGSYQVLKIEYSEDGQQAISVVRELHCGFQRAGLRGLDGKQTFDIGDHWKTPGEDGDWKECNKENATSANQVLGFDKRGGHDVEVDLLPPDQVEEIVASNHEVCRVPLRPLTQADINEAVFVGTAAAIEEMEYEKTINSVMSDSTGSDVDGDMNSVKRQGKA